MTVLLSKAGSKLTVKQLLDTLAETMDFEASVSRKNSIPVSLTGVTAVLKFIQGCAASGDSSIHYTSQCEPTFKVNNIRF